MTASLSTITEFIAAHPHYAAWAVFLLAFSEAIPIVGTVVPGSTLVVAISALAIEADISPWLLLVAATLGAIGGDGTSFWLGQRCHRQVLERWPLNRSSIAMVRPASFWRASPRWCGPSFR
jgi:membrane protein DedA with SNARE-associated domain